MIFLWIISKALNTVIMINIGCDEKHSFYSEERGENQIQSLISPYFFVEPEGLLQRMMCTSIGGEKNPFYFTVVIQLSSTFFLLTACFKAMFPNVRLFSLPGYRVRNWKTIPFCETLKCWCLMTPNSICGGSRVLFWPGLHSPRGRGEFLSVYQQASGLHRTQGWAPTTKGNKPGFEANKQQILWGEWDSTFYHTNCSPSRPIPLLGEGHIHTEHSHLHVGLTLFIRSHGT